MGEIKSTGLGEGGNIYYKIEIFGHGGSFILEEVAGDGAVGEGMLLWHCLLPYGREIGRFEILFFWER